jgi:gas vesicle protein
MSDSSFWNTLIGGMGLGAIIGMQIGIFMAERKHKVPKNKRYWW